MINFSFNKEDKKMIVKEIFFLQAVPLIVYDVISFVWAVFHILIAYFDDSNYLKQGYFLLLCNIIAILLSVGLYCRIKKTIFNIFKEEVINLAIQKDNEKFQYKNIDTGNILEFTKIDIKKTYNTKNLFVVRLRTKKTVMFPKQQDIIDLFKN